MILRLLMVTLALGLAVSQIPPNFDARDVWPDCMGPVYDQIDCKSSWAIALAGMASDRFCIAKKTKVALSPQMLVSCTTGGCTGSFDFDVALNYMATPGIPTSDCVAYKHTAPDCPTKCDNGGALQNYKCQLKQKLENAAAIQTEIMKNGPVVSAFYETIDFPHYYDGVYYHAHTKKRFDTMTAAKIVGWGRENGIAYWIGQTAYGASFGENGYVRFKMDEDACTFAYLCTPSS